MKRLWGVLLVILAIAAPGAAVAIVKAVYAAGFEAGAVNGATLAAQGCR